VEPRAAGRVLVGDVGVGDQDGMRLVVDAGYYVSVALEGEDQRRVALADKADPVVAAVRRRGIEPERVVDVLAAACGFGAGIGDGIGYGEEELDTGRRRRSRSRGAIARVNGGAEGETRRVVLVYSARLCVRVK